MYKLNKVEDSPGQFSKKSLSPKVRGYCIKKIIMMVKILSQENSSSPSFFIFVLLGPGEPAS